MKKVSITKNICFAVQIIGIAVLCFTNETHLGVLLLLKPFVVLALDAVTE